MSIPMTGKIKMTTAAILILFLAVVFCMPQSASAAVLKPGKVKKVTVTSVTYNSVCLRWSRGKNAKSYDVYRAQDKDGKYELVRSVKGTAFVDRQVETGASYWYRVKSVNNKSKLIKTSGFSPKMEVPAIPKLSVPAVKTSSDGEGVLLDLSKVEGSDGYVILKDGRELHHGSDRSMLDEDTVAGEKHNYRAVAYRYVKGSKIVRSTLSKSVEGVRAPIQVKATGVKKISKMKAGTKYSVKGTVQANMGIKKVYVGVYNAKEDKWVKGSRYIKKDVNARSYDISEADETVKVSALPAGKYFFRVQVFLKDGSSKTPVNKKFTVEGSRGAQAAVDWAVQIANDDSFAYGKGSVAHRAGCYFCGTNYGPNKYLKKSGYKKTYCCNTFIFSAYAHGAKNPAMLADCKKGKNASSGMSPSGWSKYGCFQLVGACKDVPFKDLQVGDVILANHSSGVVNGKKKHHHHVWMFCGGNNMVEAHGSSRGFQSNSILVSPTASKLYAEYSAMSNTYVMRYTGE